MNRRVLRLERTRRLTEEVYELVLSGDAASAPGQFVNLALPGKFLRRPFSVCACTPERVTLLVRAVGGGTRDLVRLPTGTALDALTGLGRGFTLPDGPEGIENRVILAGGGVGIAPLYGLAAAMCARGWTPVLALGFRTRTDSFYLDEFSALGCAVSVATEDGSLGIQGRVTDLLSQRPDRDYVYCCGPSPMLEAVHALGVWTGGQFSFEARMGCGFGACMGCTIPTVGGGKRVCREGPVFSMEEIVWRTCV